MLPAPIDVKHFTATYVIVKLVKKQLIFGKPETRQNSTTHISAEKSLLGGIFYVYLQCHDTHELLVPEG